MKNDLTRVEIEILSSLSNGYSSKEIAKYRYVSIETIKTHCRNIRYKLDAKNAAHCVAIAIREGHIL